MSQYEKSNSAVIARSGRVGAIRFLNTAPLIYRLSEQPDIRLSLDVPGRLGRQLDEGQHDVSLVSSIDYQHSRRPWRILPVGAIGSMGQVLTVRVFSRTPADQIQSVACDGDSHTARAMLQILWHHQYHRRLEVTPLTHPPETYSSVLLIGDKVLGHLGRWPYEIDLGSEWAAMTHLPFVYAVWAAPDDGDSGNGDIGSLADRLDAARREGLANLDAVIASEAAAHGFNAEQARRYLTKNLCFDFGAAQQQGLQRFFELAADLQLIPTLRPIRVYPRPTSSPAICEGRL